MSSFIIRVTTGLKWGAATNTKVKIRLYDSEGMKTRWIDLDVGEFNALEIVNLLEMPIGKKIEKIELERDAFWFRTPGWYAQHVEVESVETNDVYFFPIHRWIIQGRFYTFKQYDTVLPQGDDHKEQRHEELEEKRKHYEYMQPAPGYPVVVS